MIHLACGTGACLVAGIVALFGGSVSLSAIFSSKKKPKKQKACCGQEHE